MIMRKHVSSRVRKGFTLVELIVVMAIIAVLAGVSIGAYIGIQDKAQNTKTTAYQKQVQDYLLAYRTEKTIDTSFDSESANSVAYDFVCNYLPAQGFDNTALNYTVLEASDAGKSLHRSRKGSNPLLSSDKADIVFAVTSPKYAFFTFDGKNVTDGPAIYKKANDLTSQLVEKLSSSYDTEKISKQKMNAFQLMMGKNADGKTVKGLKSTRVTLKGLPDGDEELYVPNGETIYDADYENNGSSLLGVKASAPASGSNFAFSFKPFGLNNGAKAYFDVPLYVTEDAKAETGFYQKEKAEGEETNTNPVSFYYEPKHLTITDIDIGSSVSLDFKSYEAALTNVTINATKFTYCFGSLDDLIPQAAKDTTAKHKLLIGNATLSKELTIGADSNISSIDLGWDINNYAKGFAEDIHSVSGKTGSLLTIAQDVTLTLNQTMNVWASFKPINGGQVGTVSSKATVHNSGKILLNASSVLNVAGLVTGTGSIVAKANSAVRDFMNILDFQGGTISYKIFEKVFPFGKYQLTAIECPMTFEKDAAFVFQGKLIMFSFALPLLGKAADSSLFSLDDGTVSIAFEDSFTDLGIKTKRMLLSVNGSLHDNAGVSDKIPWLTIRLDSLSFPLYNIGISLSEGSKAAISHISFKFLPGSFLSLAKNATVDFEKDVVFYEHYDYAAASTNATNKRLAIATTVPAAYVDLPKDTYSLIFNGNVGGSLRYYEAENHVTFGKEQKVTMRELKDSNKASSETDGYVNAEVPVSWAVKEA